jgi:transcriptional regulator with XRE-family HTH domain
MGSRRRLGAELRRLRLRSGLTLDEVAERMACSTSKISRLENGKGVPKAADVRELVGIYRVGSDAEVEVLLQLVRDGREHGWWEELTDGVHPERYVLDAPGRYAALESDAVAVRSFDAVVVPGMLQTRAYAHAVIGATLPHRDAADIERLTELRVRRQRALERADPGPLRYLAVLDESVLHRVVGSEEIMAEQLRYLLDAAALPNVVIRILPFSAGYARAHAGHFTLLDIPPDFGSDVVFLEGQTGDTYLDSPTDVALYKDVLADVTARALDPHESLRVIGGSPLLNAPPQEGQSAR